MWIRTDVQEEMGIRKLDKRVARRKESGKD